MTEPNDQNDLAAVTVAPHHPPLFEARGLTKSFGSNLANQDISLTVRAGETHALLGENGAGKSTFVKMIDGVLRPDAGQIFLDGQAVNIASPADARRRGIGMVFQHFSTFDALSVAENIALTMPGTSLKDIRKGIRDTAQAYGLDIAPSRRIESLSAGEKQRVEIVRCLLQKPRLLILDEPTSVLTPQEAKALFETLRTLSASGVAIIYISHRLEEVRALCDRATILRRGKVVATCDPREQTASALAEMMIGETAAPISKGASFVGGARLSVENLSMPVSEGVSLSKINFSARKGEILGIAGVAGEGQSELFAALSGERRTTYQTAIQIDGHPVGSLGTTARRRLNAAFAPEQRLGHAAIGDLPLSKNLELTRHSIRGTSRRKHRDTVTEIREQYDVRGGAGDPMAGTLSGGNLQKFVIGRELDRDPGVFVAAQPTWGIDAGAAMMLRNKLVELAQNGSAVVIISQDLDEIFQICDRVAVMHRGALSPTYAIDQMTPEKIGMLMTGSDPAEIETTPPADKPPEQPAPAVAAPAKAPSEDPKPGSDESIGSIGSTGGTVSAPWTPPESNLHLRDN